MRVISYLLLLFVFVSCQTQQVAPLKRESQPDSKPLSIMQGSTSKTQTIISIVKLKSEALQYLLRDKAKHITPTRQLRATRASSAWEVVTLYYDHLNAYEYRLDILNEKNKIVDSRQLHTLKGEQKIAIASCMNDSYTKLQERQWRAILNQKPTALILGGDNLYLKPFKKMFKTITPDYIWQRYIENRNALELYKSKQLVPTYAIWDDNDFGPKNSGKTFRYKDESQKIFLTFFPQTKYGSISSKGPGIASTLRFKNLNFILLDNRSFRSENDTSKKQSHLGEKQKKWLFKQLTIIKQPSFLVSGNQFFGSHHPFESFSKSHPTAFKTFLSQLKKKQAIVLISGDRHLLEFQTIPSSVMGYRTYELTTSGLHSKYYPGTATQYPSFYPLFSKDGETNYMILDNFQVSNNQLQFKVSAYGDSKKILYRRLLKVKK